MKVCSRFICPVSILEIHISDKKSLLPCIFGYNQSMKSALRIFSWKKSGVFRRGCLGVSRAGKSMEAMEADRWWPPAGDRSRFIGGDEAPREGARSALVRRDSDQLKASPTGRKDKLDLLLERKLWSVLAAVGEGAMLPDDVVCRLVLTEVREEEDLPFPVLSRRACAPNENRRANGDVAEAGGLFSFSITATSSR